MKIDVQFHGPYSQELVDAGAFDMSLNGSKYTYIGKGKTRIEAAAVALELVEFSCPAEYVEPSIIKVNQSFPETPDTVEGDPLCDVYCIVRIYEND